MEKKHSKQKKLEINNRVFKLVDAQRVLRGGGRNMKISVSARSPTSHAICQRIAESQI